MKLPGIKDIRKFSGDKVLGKKEKGLGKFMIECVDCGCMIDIDRTTCPRKIKNLVKRNIKMRAVAMIALQKMSPRCPDCHKKFLAKGGKETKVSGDDMKMMAEEAAEESKDQ